MAPCLPAPDLHIAEEGFLLGQAVTYNPLYQGAPGFVAGLGDGVGALDEFGVHRDAGLVFGFWQVDHNNTMVTPRRQLRREAWMRRRFLYDCDRVLRRAEPVRR